jgi:hypothetical protein
VTPFQAQILAVLRASDRPMSADEIALKVRTKGPSVAMSLNAWWEGYTSSSVDPVTGRRLYRLSDAELRRRHGK